MNQQVYRLENSIGFHHKNNKNQKQTATCIHEPAALDCKEAIASRHSNPNVRRLPYYRKLRRERKILRLLSEVPLKPLINMSFLKRLYYRTIPALMKTLWGSHQDWLLLLELESYYYTILNIESVVNRGHAFRANRLGWPLRNFRDLMISTMENTMVAEKL